MKKTCIRQVVLDKWLPLSHRRAAVLHVPDPDLRQCTNTPLLMGGFKLGWGGPCFFVFVRVLLHKKGLGHPAKAQHLETLKPGFHPPCETYMPKGGFSELPRTWPAARCRAAQALAAARRCGRGTLERGVAKCRTMA